MTIMARMLKIPTRMVNGFSQGRYVGGDWVVTGGDAHSWVQAFFPQYGWINFDPTPSFSPNALPSQQPPNVPTPAPSPTVAAPTPTVAPTATPPTLQKNHPDDPTSSSTASSGNSILWIAGTLIGLLLAVVLLLVAVLRYWWLNLYTSSPLISGIYWRFCRLAGFFGLAPRTWQTPYEYGRMIGQQFPHRAAAFSRLTDLFVREHWGGPQQAVQGLQEAEVKDLSSSFPSLLINFLFNKLRRKTSP
jgi:hypothetical protein